MYLCAQIKCVCGSKYELDNNVSLEKACCPNCGKTAKYSENIIKILKLANEITDPLSTFDSDTESASEHIDFTSDFCRDWKTQ